MGKCDKTFDFGGEIKIGANQHGNGDWSISSPRQGDQLLRPENFRVKIIGAARRGSAWHGNKFSVGID